MDNEPSTVRVPSSPTRVPSTLVVAAAVLVTVAIVKPWAFGSAGSALPPLPSTPPTLATAMATTPPGPAATPVPTQPIWDPNAIACMSSEGDRLLAFVRAPGLEVRTWLVLTDPSLADPLDPAAVPLRLPSSHVIGLGVCARRQVQAATVPSAAEILDVRSVTQPGGVAVLTDLGPPIVITPQVGLPDMGVLYGPPVGPLAPHAGASPDTSSRSPGPLSPSAGPGSVTAWPTWPLGAYALAFRFAGDGPSVLRWVRLDILPAVGMYD